jgi:hypothetical protein
MKPTLISLALLTAGASAQTTGDSSDWEFGMAMYAPLMGLDGDIGVRGFAPVAVDMSFGDILEELDGGLSGAFSAKKGPWSITADAIWLKISTSAAGPVNSYVRLGQDQVMGSLSLGYEIYSSESTSIELAAGGAFNIIDADVDLFTPRLPVPVRSGSASQEWIDPYVALRFQQRLGECWNLFASGAYGGFDVSSDEYWQVIAGISYRMSDSTSIALAYRIISVDYRQGGFVYDTETSGPNLGLVFRF